MSYSPDELVKIATGYEELASEALIATANEKAKKKSDPKAKKRNKDKTKSPQIDVSSNKEKKSSIEYIESLLAKYAAE